MPYTPATNPLGHDATPDWEGQADTLMDEIGHLLAAIPHKEHTDFSRWTIVGWRYVGTNGWADVDSDGVCYAVGKAYYP